MRSVAAVTRQSPFWMRRFMRAAVEHFDGRTTFQNSSGIFGAYAARSGEAHSLNGGKSTCSGCAEQ